MVKQSTVHGPRSTERRLRSVAIPWFAAMLMTFFAPAARAGADEDLVDFAARAMWDDHADVRDGGFPLRRAGVDPAETAEALAGLLPDRPARPADRVRAARLIGRIGADTPAVRAALGRCAGSDDPDLRWAARRALGTLDRREARR